MSDTMKREAAEEGQRGRLIFINIETELKYLTKEKAVWNLNDEWGRIILVPDDKGVKSGMKLRVQLQEVQI